VEYEEWKESTIALTQELMRTCAHHFDDKDKILEDDAFEIIHGALSHAVVLQSVIMKLSEEECMRLVKASWKDLVK